MLVFRACYVEAWSCAFGDAEARVLPWFFFKLKLTLLINLSREVNNNTHAFVFVVIVVKHGVHCLTKNMKEELSLTVKKGTEIAQTPGGRSLYKALEDHPSSTRIQLHQLNF